MADVQTSEVDTKFAPVNVTPWNCEFSQVFKGRTTFNKIIFTKYEECELGGRLKVKIRILFYGDNS
jgi:hypothetical protein